LGETDYCLLGQGPDRRHLVNTTEPFMVGDEGQCEMLLTLL